MLGQETPGEDPHVTSEYAVAFVQGMQGNHPHYLKVSACLKHLSAYSQETARIAFSAIVTTQDMEDTYLPAFKAGVVKANASGIMCSYNAETYGDGIFGPNTWNANQHGGIPSW
jgi:beta-glucosidase-like glycosyl hydrolase